MSCDICGRLYHPQRLPFLCAVDARNQLYERRIAHVAALVHNEKLEEQVNEELAAGATAAISAGKPAAAAGSSSTTRIQYDSWESERQEALSRAHDATSRADQLRRDLKAVRKELDERKETMRQRRSDLAAAANGTVTRRARVQADVERSISMTKFKWNAGYEAMGATRAFLCMEASKLYGLRRIKKDSAVRYELGGLEVVDPYNMNNLPPEVISTGLAHITHILMLACHYLSIRLPAEVTLPHRDYPRPTIFSLSSSYSHGEVPFPGTANLHPSLAANLRNTRDLFQHVPRARPLFIDKVLPLLAKEDEAAHTLFLEGIALLAYNIAWACYSQGVSIGDKASFDDVFSMGRNLYNLFVDNQLINNPTGRIFSTTAAGAALAPGSNGGLRSGNGGSNNNNSSSNGTSNTSDLKSAMTPAAMGRYSHGTAHTFLNDSFVQTFKVPSPNRLADRLRTRLSSESTMPDWEVLEDDAWAVEDEDQQHMEDGVLHRVVVSPTGAPGRRGGPGSAASGSSGSNNRNRNSSGYKNVVVGSRVPEKRLYGVESMASVITSLEDTLAGGDVELLRGKGHPSSRGPAPAPNKPKGSGAGGWVGLRNR